MNLLVSLSLLFTACIHLIPVVGLLGASRLTALYGVSVDDPNLALLMRHRAALFGMLGGFLGYAAIRPILHGAGLAAAWTSVLTFLLLATTTAHLNRAVQRVALVDLIAAGLLAIGSWAHLCKAGAG